MATYVALLRGINVGGKNLLPMKSLAALLETLGADEVRTYIQSGNVVLRHRERSTAKLAKAIAAAIEREHGFRPELMLLTPKALAAAIEGNPFPKAVSDPKTLHVTFLSSAPKTPDLAALERLKTKTERFVLDGRVFYLHAPDGIGRSKLAMRIETSLGVSGTARNWRTVMKLAEMVREVDG